MRVSTTVISHFYNEEYLLPWWLNHHKQIFDHGILIDYHSTDRSREIIREIVPSWDLVTSRNISFAARAVDLEVEHYESMVSGWKMALNTSEFLIGNLEKVVASMTSKEVLLSVPGRTMVDIEPNFRPDHSSSLVGQKPWGVDSKTWASYKPFVRGRRSEFWRARVRAKHKVSARRETSELLHATYNPGKRNRLLHSCARGNYEPGRHSWRGDAAALDVMEVFWFGLSPWNDESIERKLQIRGRIPKSDVDDGFGIHHLWTQDELTALHQYWLRFVDISPLLDDFEPQSN